MNGPRSFSGKGGPASLPACAIAGESPASIAAPSAAINVGPLRPRRIDVTGGKGSVACSRPPRVEDGARAGGALGAAQIGLEAAGRVAVSHPEHPAAGGGFAGEARVEERWRRGIDRLEDELHLTAAAAGGIRQAPHSRSRHWTAARLRPGPPPDSGMRAYALEPNTRESEDADRLRGPR